MAIWIPSPNYMSRNGWKPKWIICHGTAGFTTAQQVGNYFAQSSSQVSSHYVVGQDGTVVQCVDEQYAAWANGPITSGADSWWYSVGNPNWATISIEHVKPHTDNSDQLTDAQKAATFKLIKEICVRWNIPFHQANSNGGITGHFSTDPVNRSRCPGPFPWNELFALGVDDMLDLTDAFASAHFEQAGNSWKCKSNGITIGEPFLSYYRHSDGALRLPVTVVHTEDNGVRWQRFESGILAYDPKNVDDNPGVKDSNGVYVIKLTSDLAKKLLFQSYLDQIKVAQDVVTQAQTDNKALKDQVAAQQQSVATLQQQLAALQQQLTQAQGIDHAPPQSGPRTNRRLSSNGN
ncbi:N-acetylmuramoyl-L-alanine amidase [Ktedonospora formicarum]|uniref:N-acetylmuramoyl-L-alanine amidase n=1 Tax=Ktedonospora formicarum TaxID=2778364 RepID=A0A8J3HYV8_9CHLR|nr:peptidoglycan recognition family protein [Ktedonospora formicarum]GHO44506.1 hypothetical protein KSX_26690 [Ktedonospora formicarum]